MSFFLTIILLISGTNVKVVVKEFHELDTKESEAIFINNYRLCENPSILAYVCAIEMKQAKYSNNLISKFKIFNRSKKKLDLLIESNPFDVHLRYIRLVLQEKTPSILGYNYHIKKDKILLRNKLEVIDNTDYLDFFIYNNTSL